MITQISATVWFRPEYFLRKVWTEEVIGIETISYYKYSIRLPHTDYYDYWMVLHGKYPR